MKIALIAAMSTNRVIGINNDLPWHLPDDMKYFMNTTLGRTVIMGRKNYDSLPSKYKPLPNRTNVIITRQNNYQVNNCQVVGSMEAAIQLAQESGEGMLFIIGGGQIYELGLEYADEVYLTEIDAQIEKGEVFFPELGSEWLEHSRKHHPKDDRHQFSFDFVIYKKEQ